MAKHSPRVATVPTEISWLSSVYGVLFILRHLQKGEPDLQFLGNICKKWGTASDLNLTIPTYATARLA